MQKQWWLGGSGKNNGTIKKSAKKIDFSGLVHCSQVSEEDIFLSLGLESW